jgi:hypothetical protein
MAVVEGTVHTVNTLVSDSVGGLQVAAIKFTVAGTYDQSDDGILEDIADLIQGSRRNGKTVTLVDVMRGQRATKSTDPTKFMSVKTVAISTNDVTFELTDESESTELGAGAVPAQDRPFEILVAFTEA